MPYIPGVKLPYADRNTNPGGRKLIHIGSHGGDRRLLGSTFNSGFGEGTGYVGLGGNVPAGGRTSFANYGPVLEARRQQKLASTDPGLSGRGRVGAPGRAGRAVTGGLEGRGVRPTAGSRLRPGPMYGPGRGELAAVNRGRAAQRSAIYGNLDANRARAGSGAGISRMEQLAGKRMEQHGQSALRRQHVLRNIEASRAGRTGGFKAALGPTYGPGRKELGDIIRERVKGNIAKSSAGRDARMGARAVRDSMRNTTRVQVRPRTPVGSTAKVVGDTSSKVVDDASRMGKSLMGAVKKHPILAGAGIIGLGAYLGGREKRGTSSGARGAYR